MYTSEDISALFEHVVNLIDIDTEASVQKFNEGIYRAGHCMQRTVVTIKMTLGSIISAE